MRLLCLDLENVCFEFDIIWYLENISGKYFCFLKIFMFCIIWGYKKCIICELALLTYYLVTKSEPLLTISCKRKWLKHFK